MNRRHKLLAVVVGVAALLVLMAAVVLPMLVDSDLYRGKVIALVKAQTGRDLHIDGAVRLRLLPEPQVTVTDVRLGNPPGFAGADLASLSALSVQLRLWPLLRGRLATRGLEVRGLALTLERDEHGRGNWEDLSGAAQSADAPEPDAIDALPAAMAIGGLAIRDATINWRDPMTGAVTAIAQVDVQTGAFHVGKSIDDVRIRATLTPDPFREVPASIELRGDVALGVADGTLGVPNLDASVADLTVAGVRIDGRLGAEVSADLSRQRLTFDALQVSANAFDDEDARATLEIGATLDFDLAHRRLAEAALSVKVPAYSVSGIAGELQVEGVLAGDLAAGIYTLKDFRSHGTAGGAGDPHDPRAFRFDADLELDAGKRTLTAKHLQLSGPDLQANGELTVNAVQAGMGGLFDLTIDDQYLHGNFTVTDSPAGLALELDVSADLDIGDGRYALRGRHDLGLRATVSRSPVNERYRVADLRVNARLADPASPDGRLAVGLHADVDVDLKSETLRSDNLRVELPESRIAGSVDVRGFDTPALRFDLDADAIDADRLLPPAPAPGDGRARTAPLGATIAAIRALDLDGEIRVQKLTLRGLQMSNVRLTSRGDTAAR